MPDFPIVARRFSPAEFRAYLAGIAFSAFRPTMVVLHNTAVPTLGDRPNGFTEGSMHDLEHYYARVQGWSGGPHLFVDDLGIWVFNPLDKRGVHSPNWNSVAWGVEMLGDYESESFEDGRGAKVRDNAVAALAAMFGKLGLQPTDEHFKLHHEDPKTTHACPGKKVQKNSVRAAVVAAMAAPYDGPIGHMVKVVVYRKGKGNAPVVLDGRVTNGTTFVDAAALSIACGLGQSYSALTIRPLREIVGDRYTVTPRMDQGKVYLVER